ncbi:hypothetical protein B0O80DRAFT_529730 [Mortierella sp. GBAus27b]|nr:hypothetical protein B0O80DRAFT_529730 [Mortierella sp. GBAus27b]
MADSKVYLITKFEHSTSSEEISADISTASTTSEDVSDSSITTEDTIPAMIDPVDTPTSTGTVTDSSDPQNVSNTPTGSKGPSVVAPASSLEARPAHGRRRGQEQSCSAPGSATEANTGGWELSMIKDVHTCHELDPNTILFDRKALKLKPQVQRVVRKCARATVCTSTGSSQRVLSPRMPKIFAIGYESSNKWMLKRYKVSKFSYFHMRERKLQHDFAVEKCETKPHTR